MVRMRADRADLGESRHAHAESRHRGQLAVAAYAYVSAEIVSTFAEGTRLGDFRECHHLRRIGIGQFDEFIFQRINSFRLFRVKHHLQQWNVMQNAPASHFLWRIIAHNANYLSNGYQPGKSSITIAGRLFESG